MLALNLFMSFFQNKKKKKKFHTSIVVVVFFKIFSFHFICKFNTKVFFFSKLLKSAIEIFDRRRDQNKKKLNQLEK